MILSAVCLLIVCVDHNHVDVNVPPVHTHVQVQAPDKKKPSKVEVDLGNNKARVHVGKSHKNNGHRHKPNPHKYTHHAPQQHHRSHNVPQTHKKAPSRHVDNRDGKSTHHVNKAPQKPVERFESSPANKPKPKNIRHMRQACYPYPVKMYYPTPQDANVYNFTLKRYVVVSITTAILFFFGMLLLLAAWLGYMLGFKDDGKSGKNMLRAIRNKVRK